LPVSTPSATTPAAVAWKLVIFAVSESLDDEVVFALAGAATAAANASAEKPATTSLRIVSSLGG
jgi:hypothetical protein